MKLFAHELRAEQLLFWRNREAAIFTFFLPVIFFLIFASVYGNDRITKEGGIRAASFLEAGMIGYGVAAETTGGFCLPAAPLAISGEVVVRALYDTLTIPNDKGEYVPYLAKTVTHNADFTQWDITVRSGDTVVWGSSYFHTVSFVPQPPLPDFVLVTPQPAGPPMLVVNPQIAFPSKPSPVFDPTQYFNSADMGQFSPAGNSWASVAARSPGAQSVSVQVKPRWRSPRNGRKRAFCPVLWF